MRRPGPKSLAKVDQELGEIFPLTGKQRQTANGSENGKNSRKDAKTQKKWGQIITEGHEGQKTCHLSPFLSLASSIRQSPGYILSAPNCFGVNASRLY